MFIVQVCHAHPPFAAAVFNVKEGVEEKLKGSDIKRASRRTVLLIGGYTGAIQLPLRQLKGVGIGRVVELPLPPKGML